MRFRWKETLQITPDEDLNPSTSGLKSSALTTKLTGLRSSRLSRWIITGIEDQEIKEEKRGLQTQAEEET
ncbi:hypothetical protein OUZ56_024526 [Daphnia magna]|uniref:Uncharacterized protein n=1 Tax=Daphnia magna TaxID=35525 RepID=A0ABR0B163_9CRUS|nr:hypothetical protein OUZ56_024526 [Daphnia magna]